MLLSFATLVNFKAQAQEEPNHDGLSINCAEELSLPLSTKDWYDCPYPGDIMHCQGFVEIGSNVSPTNKLEVSHGNEEYPRQGISLNCTRDDEIRTSEIYFRYQNHEQWALGNDFFTNGEHNFFIWDHLNGITRMFFNGMNEKGDIFVGVNNNTAPIANFDVNGTIRSSILTSAGPADIVQANVDGILGNVPITNFASDLNYWQSNGTDVSRASGKVFIGMSPCPSCTSGGYNLYVEGGIKAREIKVTALPFPDFVFDKKYQLHSLTELEQYISENKHLPNIPSAAEVEKNEGIEIGNMQNKLLQTIEEQTLYIIDLQKQMDELKKEFASIKK